MEAINTRLFEFIFGLSHKNPLLDGVFVFAANYLAYVLVLLFLFLVIRESGWRKRFFFFGETALAVLISRGIFTELIRFFYAHPRPFDALGFTPLIPESGNSFPSGHAAWFFAMSMVIFFYNRKWGIWFFILSAINGIARIYVGVHWPLDVLGGAILGMLVGSILHAAFKNNFEKLYKSPGISAELH